MIHKPLLILDLKLYNLGELSYENGIGKTVTHPPKKWKVHLPGTDLEEPRRKI